MSHGGGHGVVYSPAVLGRAVEERGTQGGHIAVGGLVRRDEAVNGRKATAELLIVLYETQSDIKNSIKKCTMQLENTALCRKVHWSSANVKNNREPANELNI